MNYLAIAIVVIVLVTIAMEVLIQRRISIKAIKSKWQYAITAGILVVLLLFVLLYKMPTSAQISLISIMVLVCSYLFLSEGLAPGGIVTVTSGNGGTLDHYQEIIIDKNAENETVLTAYYIIGDRPKVRLRFTESPKIITAYLKKQAPKKLRITKGQNW